MRGRMKEAVGAYSAALDRLPDDVRLLNRVAWILATTSDDGLRDATRAKSLAERAVRLTEGRDPVSLDSLGASLAGLAQFEQAVGAATEALQLARRDPGSELLRDLEFRLGLYSRGQPFREP
jgi:tetratricopeptide (TPR) repeat protein